eukprot:6939483-Ditylum_brightwellii.AAC.1
MEGFEHPVRARLSGNKTIGSYVDVLTNGGNREADLHKSYKKQFNRVAVRKGVRRVIVTTEEDYNSNNVGIEEENKQNLPDPQHDTKRLNNKIDLNTNVWDNNTQGINAHKELERNRNTGGKRKKE